MKYTIGEFAEILGVTTDTLRLYEKFGIIKPIKNNKNNYRYFNDLDARSLLMSRWYRSMRIPLQEVAKLTKESSLDNIMKQIKKKQIDLENEIEESKMLLSKIAEINESFKKIKESLNKCTIKKSIGIYRLKQTNRNILLNDESSRGRVNAWMDTLPYTFYSFRIDHKEIISQGARYDYNWGLAISEHEIDKLDLKIDEKIEYLGPQTCVSSIILSSGHESIMRDSLQFMINYVKENHYTIKSDISGKILLTENIDGVNKSYLEVDIPIYL